MSTDRIRIDNLLVRAIVGLHDWERRGKQDVLLSITLHVDLRAVAESDSIEHGVNYAHVARNVIEHVEHSQRFTIETLATDVAGICLSYAGVSRVGVRLCKPSAERYAKAVEVEIERGTNDLARTAYVLLGSNDLATERLPRGFGLLGRVGRVEKVTGVYESAAAASGSRAAGGPNYLNAAVAITTTLPAGEIKRRLKAIEQECGRIDEGAPSVPLDLDLCLLGSQVIDAADVRLPHPHVAERHDAAALLAMLDDSLTHPVTGEPLRAIAARLGTPNAVRLRPDMALR